MNRFNEIAVLIPTINESTLDAVVASVQDQAPDLAIYILGFDQARQIAEKYQVNFVDLKTKTRKSTSVNLAVKSIDKEWFIILDADAIPKIHWAENMLKEFEQGKRIFSGSVDIDHGNFWMKTYNLSLLHEFTDERPSGYRKHLPAINLGFTKTFFEQNGPFCEDLIRSQDYEWSLRAYQNDERLFFTADAVVEHLPVNKNSFFSLWNYWQNSGYENWLVRQKYRSILQTPFFMKWPWFILIFSPVLAVIPTLRILSTSPKRYIRYLYLVPWIYLTKLAWCFGVFRKSKTKFI
jgi:GT2 family glycosyltransferase